MHAFRMRVSISAIGSLTLTTLPPYITISVEAAVQRPFVLRGAYQLDFVTPGIRPLSACSRKQIRHMPNLRM
jgi:hypothetical protein